MQKDYNDDIAFETLDTSSFEQMPYKYQLKTKLLKKYIPHVFNKDGFTNNDPANPTRGYRHKQVLYLI